MSATPESSMIADAVREFIGVEPYLALTYLMCVILGVVINWAKRSHESGISIFAYWTQHPIRSQSAILATISAFAFTLVTDPESSKLSYVAIGFAFDNLLSKQGVDKEELDRYKNLNEAAQVKLKMYEETRNED